MSKQVNNFVALDAVREAYRRYVATFQRFRNPVIKEWVKKQVQEGTILWREPLIELNRRYKEGERLEKFVDRGILEPEILKIFRKKVDDPNSPPIQLYYHQSIAIKKLLEDQENVVVATGTGSGKSFCFGIPIVNECLKLKRLGKEGIKAIIVYPMNALANSQYEVFTTRLVGTGLKVGKYTGDTPESPEEAISRLKGREPLDSEVLSRTEIRQNPPDILMTNYVMLDLLLTRFEDRKLFPPEHRGQLRFLVLDEMHTYKGHRGADVACLIRRLKQRTGTKGKIRCIGTSATIESQTTEAAADVIARVATELFGEPFYPRNVIEETYQTFQALDKDQLELPESIMVIEDDVERFDGTFKSAIPLAEALLGRNLKPHERTPEGLGKSLIRHPTIRFIQDYLKRDPKPIFELAKKYGERYRPTADLREVLLEIQAALLAGSVTTYPIAQEILSLIVPKLHSFFSKGSIISSCLTKEGPHLNESGDRLCKKCSENGKEIIALPLSFCRSCGQEFYGVAIQKDGTVYPRPMDADVEGRDAYLTPINQETSDWEIPAGWQTEKGTIRRAYQHAVPQAATYCPDCNKINSDCKCENKIEVWLVPHPFQLCPACGVSYTRRPREYNKLFEFSSVGRSTATDVIISSLLKELPPDQQKVIAFSDNRQDTALQAAHLNDLQKRITFRQGFYQALKESDGTLRIDEVGKAIYEAMEKYGILPTYERPKGKYITTGEPRHRLEFERFLTYLTLNDLAYSPISNQLSLEEVGLLEVEYIGLDKMVTDINWSNIHPELKKIDPETMKEYITGLLDIMRRRGAIYHQTTNNTVRLWEKWEDIFEEGILFDPRLRRYQIVGFSDLIPTTRAIYHRSQRLVVIRSAKQGRLLPKWTSRALGISDMEIAQGITQKVIDMLSRKEIQYLVNLPLKDYPPLLQVNADAIRLKLNENPILKVCPKCGRVFHWEKLNLCTNHRCGKLVTEDQSENYYRQLFITDPRDLVYAHAREHSGQVPGEERKQIEDEFKEPKQPLNVLVCTPTMELGIDIGDLSAIFMRNVPPDPSHYAQRAGRAGRKGQPSMIITFCGTGYARGPHDQYFYQFPERIVAGRIVPPRFLLDNDALIKRHINALILETIHFKLPTKIQEIMQITESEDLPLEIFPDFIKDLENQLEANKEKILRAVQNAFAEEMEKYEWFDVNYVQSAISNFVEALNSTFDSWRNEYRELYLEREEINRELLKHPNKRLQGHRAAIEAKISRMKTGEELYYTYRYLSTHGFLPNYGFPSSVTSLNLYNWKAEGRGINEIERSKIIALREFAPRTTVYYNGIRYFVNKARIKTEEGRPVTFAVLICPECGNVLLRNQATQEAACPVCGASFEAVKPNVNCLELPDMSAIRREMITCDEEERRVRGYEITTHYSPNEKRQVKYTIKMPNGKQGSLTYEHNGKITVINKGARKKTREQTEIIVEGFYYCSACHEWLTRNQALKDHLETDSNKACKNKGSAEDIIKEAWLVLEGNHDTITLHVPPPEDLEKDENVAFYTTLKETLLQGILRTFHLDEEEIGGIITPIPNTDEYRVIMFETEEGGIGALNALQDQELYHLLIKNAQEVIHIDPKTETEKPDACTKACYNCLLRFLNQPEHTLLNRSLIKGTLEQLRNSSIEIEEKNDEEKFAYLLEKCESDFERKVLKNIAERNLPLPTEAQYTVWEKDEPIARVDFYYKPNICVFVDGPVHEKDYIRHSDKLKRKRLKALGYRVISIKNIDDISKLA